jgi:hypothetical protein
LKLASQGAMVVQRPIEVVNAIQIYEKDDRVMSKVAPTQILSSILQLRHTFFEICLSLLVDRLPKEAH